MLGSPRQPEGTAPSPFDPDLGPGSLKQRSVRGGLWTVGARAGAHAVRLAVMLALARILTPADFGLMAMVVSAIGVANVFRDMGLSTATVQRKGLTETQVSTLFWLNVAFGGVLSLVVLACAPLLELFYNDARALGVTMALSLSFLLNGLGTQHQALLRRKLQFAELAKVSVLSTACSATVALLLAMRDAEYWALVGFALTGDVITTALAWHYCRWVPSAPRFDRSTREMVSFGGYLVVFGFLGFLARNLHNLLIGRIFGAGSVGLFSRAYTLVLVMQNYASSATAIVALPSLSRLDPMGERYRNYYLTNVRVVTLAAAAPACFAALFSGDLIYVLFGDQWGRTADVLRWLAVGMLIQPVLHSSGLLFLSRGRSRDMMLWGMAGWTLMIACMVAGLGFGLEGLAIGYSASFFLLVWPCMAYATRETAISVPDTFRAWIPGTVTAVLATLPAWMLAEALAEQSPYLRLGAVGLVYMLFYVGLLFTIPGERNLILEILRQVRHRDTSDTE